MQSDSSKLYGHQLQELNVTEFAFFYTNQNLESNSL